MTTENIVTIDPSKTAEAMRQRTAKGRAERSAEVAQRAMVILGPILDRVAEEATKGNTATSIVDPCNGVPTSLEFEVQGAIIASLRAGGYVAGTRQDAGRNTVLDVSWALKPHP